MRVITLLLCSFFLIGSVSFLTAQEVSEKKEIAVFNLSYYDFEIPNKVLGSIDEEIRNVFVNLGRFDVIGMTYRLSGGDVNEFIDKIKLYKEENVEIPEQVQMGHEFFTEADFNRLIGSFIVVIPSVSYFKVENVAEEGKEPDYKALLKTSFSFINVVETKTFAQFILETKGENKDSDTALQKAIENIPANLTFEIKKIPEFQLKTGVLEVSGDDIVMEFGADMGVNLGDEYAVISTRVLKSGKTYTSEKGLLVVKEVSEEVSVAQILYVDGQIQSGDQLREVPRFGFDTTPYLHILIGLEDFRAVVGARQSTSLGFYFFRPIIGVEVPIDLGNLNFDIISVNAYAGGELNLTLRRLQLVPMAGIGAGGTIPIDKPEDFQISHVGGLVQATITYLFTRDIKAVLDVGFTGWVGLGTNKTYLGLLLGGGVAIKY